MKIPEAKLIGGIVHLIIILCLISSFPSWAQGPERVNVNSSARETLVEGKAFILSSEAPIEVTIANSEIAEVKDLTDYQKYVVGRKPGVTHLMLWEKQRKKLIKVFDIEVIPDITRLKEKIHAMFPEEDVKVTADNNIITLSGTVSSTAVMSQILTLAQSYASKDAPKDREGMARLNNFLEVGGVHQVMLEVRVSEMARSTTKRLGFNWNYVSDGGHTFGISLLNNLTSLSSTTSDTITVTDPINMIFRFMGAGATWTVFIDALKENGLTKILAEPTLITLSGRPANFLAGGEFPIPVPQEGGQITIEYKSFGVGLKFIPTVLSNGKISMEVAPEVSDLDYTNAVAIQGFLIPGITVRRVATVIELADGQSFAIAGLLKDEVREVVRKFPLLGDIPVLGALFRSTSFQKNETELVVIVTPHLVKPIDMKKQTMPTDQYIEPDDFEFYLLGNLEGRGSGQKPASTPADLNKGGGLEGDFGHIVQ